MLYPKFEDSIFLNKMSTIIRHHLIWKDAVMLDQVVYQLCLLTPWARTSAIPGEWIEYLINITTTIHWKYCISVILASYCTLKLCLSSSPFVNQSICQLKWFPNVLNSDISNPEVIWGITFSVFLLPMYRVVYYA